MNPNNQIYDKKSHHLQKTKNLVNYIINDLLCGNTIKLFIMIGYFTMSFFFFYPEKWNNLLPKI